jgi:hypothetical protein
MLKHRALNGRIGLLDGAHSFGGPEGLPLSGNTLDGAVKRIAFFVPVVVRKSLNPRRIHRTLR